MSKVNPNRDFVMCIQNFGEGKLRANVHYHTLGNYYSVNQPTADFSVGKWVHLAVSAKGQQWSLYLNGKKLSVKNFEVDVPWTGRSLGIGALLPNVDTFDGFLDEVYIFGEALDAARIAQLAQLD